MLRNLRRLLAILSLTASIVTCLGLLPIPFIGKLQLVPALIGLDVTMLVIILAATCLFGNIYCSIICPTGILQDIATHFTHNPRHYHQARTGYYIRPWVLAASVGAFLMGTGFAGWYVMQPLADPWSLFSRCLNAVRTLFASTDEITETWQIAVLWAHFAALLIIVVASWRWGRVFCSRVCPIGFVLGHISIFSLFEIRFDASRCTACHECERKCKCSCMKPSIQFVDDARCVRCFNCIANCKQGALRYYYNDYYTSKINKLRYPTHRVWERRPKTDAASAAAPQEGDDRHEA